MVAGEVLGSQEIAHKFHAKSDHSVNSLKK